MMMNDNECGTELRKEWRIWCDGSCTYHRSDADTYKYTYTDLEFKEAFRGLGILEILGHNFFV